MSAASFSGSGESSSCSECSDSEQKDANKVIPLEYAAAMTALMQSRRRARAASRRHHRRLAELHAVIAELLRRQQPVRLHTLHEDSDCADESGSERDSDKEKSEKEIPSEKDDGVDKNSSTSSINKKLSAENTDINTSIAQSIDGVDGCILNEVRVANRIRLKTGQRPQSISQQADSASSVCQNTPDGSVVYDAEGETECDAEIENVENFKKDSFQEDVSAQCLVSALVCCDRAVEAYDVLLALAESRDVPTAHETSRKVARRLLCRLHRYKTPASHRLTPGPWTDFHTCESVPVSDGESSPLEDISDEELELKKHIVRLKEFSSQARRLYLEGEGDTKMAKHLTGKANEKSYKEYGSLDVHIKAIECENLRGENSRLRQSLSRTKRKYEHHIRQMEKQLQYMNVDPHSHIIYPSETNL